MTQRTDLSTRLGGPNQLGAMVRSRHTAVVAVLVMAFSALVLVGSPAAAAPNIRVAITLLHIKALASAEEGACGDPDWYAKVWIGDSFFNNEDTDEQDALEGKPEIDIEWEFFVPDLDVATLDTPGRVPFRIEVHDEDGGLCFGDEHYDSSPSPNKEISGYIDLGNCTLHGPRADDFGYFGDCESVITQAGTDDDRAEVKFKVQVTPPASAPGLNIRCVHSRIWPQPGQPVTITATALDGALSPTILADNLEIWVNPNPDINSSRAPTAQAGGVGTLSHTFIPSDSFKGFTYGCRLTDNGVTIFSSWHRVTVGDPSPGFTFPKPAVPILYTGPRGSRIDVVFIVDRDTYNGALDNQFQTDVGSVITTSYYGFAPFLAAQDRFNFWLLPDNPGRADDANDGDCDHDLPVLWDDAYAFADTGAILHRKNQRDCALRGDRIFSGVVDPNVRSDALQVITHETGHQPFGLADEYCCDGGYFQQDEAPNVYAESDGDDGCEADAPSLGRAPAACREWVEPVSGWADPDWYTSEPADVTAGAANDDLMNDNGPAQAADLRRFNLMFAECGSAKC